MGEGVEGVVVDAGDGAFGLGLEEARGEDRDVGAAFAQGRQVMGAFDAVVVGRPSRSPATPVGYPQPLLLLLELSRRESLEAFR